MESIKSNNAIYELHENYVIAKYFEGSDPGLQEAIFIYRFLAEKYTSDFGWISDRVNSYSSHPEFIHNLLEDFSNFKCIAWVTYKDSLKTRISPLPGFLPKRIKTSSFHSLPEAVAWTQTILSKSSD
ncbi:hypothetical protein FE810_04605 [Thalassotalea litorea]|uniref:STAS/SEC14 domain-containing protein n=1 Tax=Thalassotalea litorea TaxID=2020715 RepID=A0A5R9IQN8_9GAMM|nr:hypothetical protein [Thalassotalea litorea]TLU66793.1 hypothetical protein FE810_04605 [Thalassotalea litorea]